MDIIDKKIRVGRIADQDRWRRDDLRACTPDERVDMLLEMQSSFFATSDRAIKRVIHIQSISVPPSEVALNP